MKNFKILTVVFLLFNLTACGQTNGKKSQQKIAKMDTEKITNAIVRAAFEAWQKGDEKLWLSYFSKDVKLLDDGNPRDFKKFYTESIGREQFTSIDKVTDNGQSIYGQYHSEIWGNFRTYFKFHVNSDGKIYLMEIGQA